MTKIEVIRGDITKLSVDAIVNAANSTLMGGGGVDGAIHDAAGPQLVQACIPLAPCPTGEVRLTPGFNLPAKFVIHTVGPVWHGGDRSEDDLLANCYRRSLVLAVREGFRTIAFPAISTGAYGFPLARAAEIAAAETEKFLLANDTTLETIFFVCFDPSAQAAFSRQVRQIAQR